MPDRAADRQRPCAPASQPRDALPFGPVRNLLPNRARAVVGADVEAVAVEAVHRRRELRVLRRGEPSLLPAARRCHVLEPRRGAADPRARGRARPASARGGRRRRRPAGAGGVQVLLVLRSGRGACAAFGVARDAAAAVDDRAAGRDQLLHLPGDLVHGRCQAPADRAGDAARHGDLPELLPAPGRGPDRPRQGIPAAALKTA